MASQQVVVNPEQIARICHETNRAYCESIGDYSQKSWNDAEEWQRQSAIRGVIFKIENPNAWKFGLVKDPSKKEHPCIVSYDELPYEQKVKDKLFQGIVEAFRP